MADTTKAVLRNALLFTDPPLHAAALRHQPSLHASPDAAARGSSRVARRPTSRGRRQRPRAGSRADADRAVAHPGHRRAHRGARRPVAVGDRDLCLLAASPRHLRRRRSGGDRRRAPEQIAIYYGELADQRRAEPRDDLITTLAAAEAEGRIARAELVSLLTILLLAGHETTTGAIGNAVAVARAIPTSGSSFAGTRSCGRTPSRSCCGSTRRSTPIRAGR